MKSPNFPAAPVAVVAAEGHGRGPLIVGSEGHRALGRPEHRRVVANAIQVAGIEVEEGCVHRQEVRLRGRPEIDEVLAVGEEDAAGDVGDACVHDRPGHKRQVVFGGIVRRARSLADLKAAVGVVAERDLRLSHVERGVDVRRQLRHAVGVVRAHPDLDRRPERGLTERGVRVEAEARARGVVVDDEDIRRDAVVDDVEGRVELAGEGQRAATAIAPGEPFLDHLRLGTELLARRVYGGSLCHAHRRGRCRDRGGGACLGGLHRVDLGAQRVDLLLLRLDHRKEPIEVGRRRRLRDHRPGGSDDSAERDARKQSGRLLRSTMRDSLSVGPMHCSHPFDLDCSTSSCHVFTPCLMKVNLACVDLDCCAFLATNRLLHVSQRAGEGAAAGERANSCAACALPSQRRGLLLETGHPQSERHQSPRPRGALGDAGPMEKAGGCRRSRRFRPISSVVGLSQLSLALEE